MLHSTSDKVLHFAFPPGQSLAGAGEASGRALGRIGPIATMPGYKATLNGVVIGGADHSDYWGDGAKGPSEQATRDAGTFLKLGDLGRDIGTNREEIEPASLAAPRDVGVFRELAAAG